MASVVIDVERVKNIHCGLGQFSLHLSRAILDAASREFEPILLLRAKHQSYYADRSARFLDVTTLRREPVASFARPLLGATRFQERCDLWHTTHQDSKCLPLDLQTPLVLTIHDLNILREKPPATIRRRLKLLQRKVDRAAVLTTASKFAADEIRQHLHMGDKEIAIIPHGVCIEFDSNDNCRPGFVSEGPFLFSIGDITPKKNFHVLVNLFKQIVASSRSNLRLVIAGAKRDEYASRIEREAEAAGLADRVILPGTVSDEERSWLYANCEAFLFPSLSEGFGLPVIEAMSCGRPVFLSSATSLPEVGGPLAFYWHEFSASTMLRVFDKGMSDFEKDPSYGERLREHASHFTWKRAAEAYLSLYDHVLKNARDGKSLVAKEVHFKRRVA